MHYGDGAIGDLEHWNEQITAWVGSLLWVPHHVAGLIAGFVGVMLVHSVRSQPRPKQFVALVFSGMAFASALGLSVWVTLIFVLFWGGWILFLYFQKEQRSLVFPMLIAGIVAFLLAGSFLMGLLSGGSGAEAGTFPISLAVRSFRFVDVFLENSTLFWKSLIRFIFLPLNYLFELGFFAFVAFIWLKLYKKDLYKNPYYFAEILLLGVSFFIGTFTRSTLIENNDLGWRAWLPGQFVLLIWGVDVLGQFSRTSPGIPILSQRMKYNLIVLIVIGVATTMLDVTLLRFAYNFAFGSEAGYHIFSARKAYTIINQTQPEDIIVQYNPSGVINRPSGLYGMRQSAISDRTAYGVPLNDYYAKVAAVSEIFEMKDLQNWEPLDALCREHSIDMIVIVSSDPLWESLDLLGRQRTLLYKDDYYAAVSCGTYSALVPTP
jgi:hypothetical protein